MSVIVVKKYPNKIVLGADTQVTLDQVKEKCHKIVKVSDSFGFAVCGYLSDVQLFHYFTKTNIIAERNEVEDVYDYMMKYAEFVKSKTGVWGNDSYFLIVNKGKCFQVHRNAFVDEIKTYCSLGSGQDFALAALHLGKEPYEAIKVACDLTIYCSEPIEIQEYKIT